MQRRLAVTASRVPQLRVSRLEQQRLDVFFEFRPARETVFASDDELRVTQREFCSANSVFGRVRVIRMVRLNALKRFRITGLVSFEEVFGLLLELLKIRPRRQRF